MASSYGPGPSKGSRGDAFQVDGVKTTVPVHQQILENDEFASGTYDTGLVGRLLAPVAGGGR